MRAVEKQGRDLSYIMVYPDDYSDQKQYPLVILLHGFGASMHDLAGLTPEIHQRGYIYACPNAPLAIDIGGGFIGYSWTPPQDQGAPEDIARTEEVLDNFFAEVMIEHRVPAGKSLLLGFSQGGSMAYRRGLKRPDLFAGVVALSCWLPDDAREDLPEERSMPIFIGHGAYDRVDIERAKDAVAFLQGAGYSPEFHVYEMGHEVSREELDNLAPWVQRVLPPIG